MVTRPLVADEERRPAGQQVRNLEGSAEGEHTGDAIVGSLRQVQPAERVGASIRGRVIVDDGEAAIVEAPAVVPSVAEGLVEREPRGRGVVDAAVHQEAIRRLLARILGRLGYFGRVLARGTGRRRLLNQCRRGQRGQRSGGKIRQLRDLVRRQQRQLPLCRCCVRGDSDFVVNSREALHVDLDLPYSVGQVGEGVEASLVGYGGELLCSLCHRDGCTRNRQATEGDLAVVCGSRSQAGEGQRRKNANQVEESPRSPPCHRCQHIPMSVRR